MSVIALGAPTGCARAADDLARRVPEGVHQLLVDGRVVEAAIAVGTVAA